MTSIYLIRHAEAEGNLYRIAQGQANSNLTDRGWRQVQALKRRFAEISIDAVYASDLYRTCATASAIYQPKGLPLHRSRDLREICVGVWEHRTWGEIYRRWPEEMDHFSHRPDLWRLEGAEEPLEARARVLKAVEQIAAENEGRTVAVFSHGYVLRMLLSYLEGYPLEQLGQTPTGDNTAVSLLHAENGKLRVIFRDDNSHLRTPEFLADEKPARRPNGLEPGLWFAPLRLPEQEEIFQDLVTRSAGSIPAPFLPPEQAAGWVTLLGYLREEPVGALQVNPASGEISLLYIRPDSRGRGFGGQLIGQAVQRTRAAGGVRITAAAPNEAAKAFLRDYGFHPADETDRLVKEIGFLSEFLGESNSENALS